MEPSGQAHRQPDILSRPQAAGRVSTRPAARERRFKLVLTSPLAARPNLPARGAGRRCQVRGDLLEWDYGRFEGRPGPRSAPRSPGWDLWRDGCPDGESAADVGPRADRVISELQPVDGDAAVFAHGHLLRVLAARWLGMPAEAGADSALSPRPSAFLVDENGRPVILLWNDAPAYGALASIDQSSHLRPRRRADRLRAGVGRRARGVRARERADAGTTARRRDMMGMSSTEWSRYVHDELGVELPPEEINDEVVRGCWRAIGAASAPAGRARGGRAARGALAARRSPRRRTAS